MPGPARPQLRRLDSRLLPLPQDRDMQIETYLFGKINIADVVAPSNNKIYIPLLSK